MWKVLIVAVMQATHSLMILFIYLLFTRRSNVYFQTDPIVYDTGKFNIYAKVPILSRVPCGHVYVAEAVCILFNISRHSVPQSP